MGRTVVVERPAWGYYHGWHGYWGRPHYWHHGWAAAGKPVGMAPVGHRLRLIEPPMW
jgi:hypothetical protein